MNNNSENIESLKYMEQYLHKKEANGKWVEYWVICRGNYLLFYSHHCEVTELRDAFRGFIELTNGTRCVIGKRKKYSFPFYLCTSKAKYYFKCPTLLLRHQWIHAIDLSIEGKYPEKPPMVLPSPNSMRKPNIIEEENSSNDLTLSNDSVLDVTVEDIEESDTHTSDIPKNVIMVTSREADSSQVTNFTSEDVSPNLSNYRVTNFLSARNDDGSKDSINGIDNLSFEEDGGGQVGKKDEETSKRSNFFTSGDVGSRNGSSASVIPIQSTSSPIYHKSDKWLFNRVTRSADSNRDSMLLLIGSSENIGSSYLNVSPSSNNLSVNTSRFSRHLVSSAPDLKAWTKNS